MEASGAMPVVLRLTRGIPCLMRADRGGLRKADIVHVEHCRPVCIFARRTDELGDKNSEEPHISWKSTAGYSTKRLVVLAEKMRPQFPLAPIVVATTVNGSQGRTLMPPLLWHPFGSRGNNDSPSHASAGDFEQGGH